MVEDPIGGLLELGRKTFSSLSILYRSVGRSFSERSIKSG